MNGNNLPLISVVIPAYNHEKYVQETIQSVIDQTYQNIELIIIDDGSTDNTWQKIYEMREVCEKRFARVVFETQKNQGTCITLNKLIKYSKGEFLAIIASDDKYLPNAIEVLYNYLEKNIDVGLVHGINLIMDENSKQCYWKNTVKLKIHNWRIHRVTDRTNVYSKKDATFYTLTQWLMTLRNININSKDYGSYKSLINVGNYISNGHLIRKSVFDKIHPFTTEAPLEDYYLMLQISKISKIKAIKDKLFYYRWHSKNTMNNINRINWMTFKTILYEKKLCTKLKKKKYIEILSQTQYNKKTFFSFGFLKLYKIRKVFITRLILQILDFKTTIIYKKH